MTKAAAIHNFWSSFGLVAYEENCVPSGAAAPDYPYLTYNVASDAIGSPVSLHASLWYRGDSWVACNAMGEAISEEIGRGGKMLPCDGGSVWILRGEPFAQSMNDPNDDKIKRKYINITAEFMTVN
mgnify:CR=1 FL=1